MKRFLVALLLGALAGGSASADDQVRRVQEALRKRNLYFGEVDGRMTGEMEGALRRYQQRQGLPPTGEVSPGTLSSLGLVAPAKGVAEWPEGPVLKGDTARELGENERRKLEKRAYELPEPVAEPPLPPEPPPVPVAEPPPEQTGPTDFVRQYLAACETNRLPEEMSFYADRLNYFDHGTVDSAFVARDVQRFYQRWPHRHYELLNCKVAPTRSGDLEATFRIAFRYANDKAQVAAGKSVNIFKIHQDQGGMHFTSMKEQVLRD